jgi:hypothetical protein
MRSFLTVVAVFSLALTGRLAFGQEAPYRSVDRPEREFPLAFSGIDAVRELADGRVLVLDSREVALRRVDWERGTANRLGREGQGPGEYRRPLDMWPLRGDSTIVFDAGNRRLLVLDPDGMPVGTRSASFSPSPGVRYTLRPRAVDLLGRVYVQPAVPAADSIPIMRFSPGQDGVDTVGYTREPVMEQSTQRSGSTGVRIAAAVPFSPDDAWHAGPDGSVAIARASDYRVEWHVDGTIAARGQGIATERIPVTEGDKRAWREAMSTDGPRVAVSQGSTPGRKGAPTPISVPEPSTWPRVKPPFDASSARIAPDGRLWLRRHRPVDDTRQLYDVFDRRGQLVDRVQLPDSTRLVGFGATSIFLARVTDDGLEYLQQVRVGTGRR